MSRKERPYKAHPGTLLNGEPTKRSAAAMDRESRAARKENRRREATIGALLPNDDNLARALVREYLYGKDNEAEPRGIFADPPHSALEVRP